MMSTLSKYSNSFMTLLMLAIFTSMVIVASRYPAGARFMPFVLGFPAIALCLLQLFLDARERHAAKHAESKSEVEKAARITAHQPKTRSRTAGDPRTRLRRSRHPLYQLAETPARPILSAPPERHQHSWIGLANCLLRETMQNS